MPLPPLLAAQAAGKAQKALTGDLYTCRWADVVGKGRKQRLIEHEIHINPVTLAVGAGLGTVGLMTALWMAQLKLSPGRATVVKAAYIWPSDYGFASRIYINQEQPSEVPDREITIPAKGYWQYPDSDLGPGTSDYKGIGGWSPGATWVETEPARKETEYAFWSVLSTEAGKKIFTIEQRRGFSAGDVLEAVKDATGLGQPIFGSWAHGQFLASSKRYW